MGGGEWRGGGVSECWEMQMVWAAVLCFKGARQVGL
jgi:hypothetical protein